MKAKTSRKLLSSILTIVVEFAVSIITVYITNKFRNYLYKRRKRNGYFQRMDMGRSGEYKRRNIKNPSSDK